MKSAVIFSILCSLIIAVSSADPDQDNKACYNKCNNDHGNVSTTVTLVETTAFLASGNVEIFIMHVPGNATLT